MYKNYEQQYLEICKNILENGYYDTNRTGVSTYKLPHQIIRVDLQKEFPILKTKFVAFKTAVKEMLWIYQKQSNVVQDLRDVNVNIWNEWEQEDGTIGHAYGYIVNKYNQIDKLIEQLKNNNQDRRMMINLWDISELDNMALQPCCFLTIFDVTNGELNCSLIQRSGDAPLGVPFNTTQFAVLTHMLAQVCGLKVGKLTHFINNAHIYENQVDGIKEQLRRYEAIPEDVINSKPTLKLNPDITNFYDFTIDDIELEDYKHMNKIVIPVSV